MRLSRLVVAVLAALVGLVWLGQGLGAIGGSVMTGSPFWAVVGGVLIAVAVAVLILERRRQTRR